MQPIETNLKAVCYYSHLFCKFVSFLLAFHIWSVNFVTNFAGELLNLTLDHMSHDLGTVTIFRFSELGLGLGLGQD